MVHMQNMAAMTSKTHKQDEQYSKISDCPPECLSVMIADMCVCDTIEEQYSISANSPLEYAQSFVSRE